MKVKALKHTKNHRFHGISRIWAFFHGRRPIPRKMSRPWSRELGWSLHIIQVAVLSQRGRAMLSVCLISFSCTLPRLQSLLVVNAASDLPMRTINFCCLQHKIKASCRKHFVVRRLPRTTNDATYQQWVSPTCQSPRSSAAVCIPLAARSIDNTWQHIDNLSLEQFRQLLKTHLFS